MSNEFVKLMKAKGLMGGEHFPGGSSTMDGVRDNEEVIEKPDGKRKSDSVDTSPTPPKKKAGCVITSPGVGYLRVAEDENDNVEEDDSMNKAEAANTQTVRKKQKKTAAEYLARPIESKVDNRSAKANINSMKTKFLTGKKKFAAIQPECGVEQDFLVIMRNNLQSRHTTNASPTAGKYMIYTRGNIRDQLLGDGIKFDPSTMYMLANEYNYEEEKIDVIDDGVEDGKVHQELDEEEKDPDCSNREKVRENHSIYNIKAVAKKMFTPGCALLNDDDDEDDE